MIVPLIIGILLSFVIWISPCGSESIFAGGCGLAKIIFTIIVLLYIFNFVTLTIIFSKYLVKKIYYFFIFIGAGLLILLEIFLFLFFGRYFL